LLEAARQRRRSSITLADVIAGAAHDIRSPLTAVRSFVSLLSQTGDAMSPEDRAEILAGMAHDAEQTDLILRLLIDAARILGEGLEPVETATRVGETVETVAAFAGADPDHPPIVWVRSDLRVKADPVELRLAVSAMVEAAVWWARDGAIEIVARAEGDIGALEVSRAGATAAAEEVEALFVPRRPGSGSGSKIGLFVSRGIAEAQGGSLDGRVVDGRFILTLRLPLAR
jgi:K+-sensing histidine kinase KdpD